MKQLLTLSFIFAATILQPFQYSIAAAETTSAKIGLILTLSGPRASLGNDALCGAELAVSELPEAVKSRLQLIIEDSQGEPRQGINAYKKLLSQGVSLVITQNSNISLPISQLVNHDNLVQVALSTTADAYSKADDLTFRVNGTTKDEAMAIAAVLEGAHSKGQATIGMLVMEDEYPKALANNLLQILQAKQIPVTFNESYLPKESDFRTIIARLKSAKVQQLAILGYQTEVGNFMRQQKELKLNATTIIANLPVNNKEYFESAGSAADGLLISYIKVNNQHLSAQKFAEKCKTPLNLFGASGYDALKVSVLALERCNFQSEPGCLKSALYKIKSYDGLSGLKSFDDIFGDMNDTYEILVAKDGAFVASH